MPPPMEPMRVCTIKTVAAPGPTCTTTTYQTGEVIGLDAWATLDHQTFAADGEIQTPRELHRFASEVIKTMEFADPEDARANLVSNLARVIQRACTDIASKEKARCTRV